MSIKEVKQAIGATADVLSVRHGVFTAKKSYYWGFADDGSQYAEKIKKLIPTAEVEVYGNHWHPFRGGAKPGTRNDSYLYCKFKA